MNKLEGIKKVRFNDFSEYDSEKCRNGGSYGFWTDYVRTESGIFEVIYGTTAEFDFCPVCGCFDNHYQGNECPYDSGYSCGEFETVTEDELLKLINSFKESENRYIEYEK